MNQKQQINNILLAFLILLSSLCIPALPVCNFILSRYFTGQDFVRIMPVAGCVIFQIQLIVNVFILFRSQKKGYMTVMIISGITVFSIVLSVIKKANPFYPIAFSTQGVNIAVLSMIHFQQKNNNENKNKMHILKTQDPLTGLPNRGYITNAIAAKINLSPDVEFSLVFIDLDDFKIVNDSLGHEVGDVFLKEAAANLRTVLHAEDFLGRMGGDEFVVIIPGDKLETEIFQIAKKLSEAISSPFIYKNKEIRITASFGITQYPKDGNNATELLQRTDMAMYRGKALGKQHITFYNNDMQKSVEKQLDIENELRGALDNEELYLVYQPQFDSVTHELRGYEALSRWNSHKLGSVSPLDFIPVAERTGDIVPLGKWILETACNKHVKVFENREDAPVLAVNISARQFQDPDFVSCVKRIIKKTGMNTHKLEFEITESVCIMNPEIILSIFAQLKNLGIEIALDDFGTGYSSLSYLSNLPFDIVKIDTSFTRKILNTPPEKNLIKTIITMAHQLGLKVIAEGVEVKTQLDYLLENKCDYIQGNYFSKPIGLSKTLVPEPEEGLSQPVNEND